MDNKFAFLKGLNRKANSGLSHSAPDSHAGPEIWSISP